MPKLKSAVANSPLEPNGMVHIQPEAIQYIPPDYGLVYMQIARRVSAINAILASESSDSGKLSLIQSQVDEAMNIIHQFETTSYQVKCS
jgi:hypothetical protein